MAKEDSYFVLSMRDILEHEREEAEYQFQRDLTRPDGICIMESLVEDMAAQEGSPGGE